MRKIAFYIDNTGRGGAQRVMCNLVEYFCDKGFEVIFINDFKLDPAKPQYNVSDNVRRIFLQESIDAGHRRVLKLRKVLKNEKPDAIVSFLRRPNIRMLLAAAGLKIKKFVSVRNDPNKEYGESFFKKLIANILFLTATGCVFQTEDAAKYFWKPVRKRSEVIYNPVGRQFFDIKRESVPRDVVTLGRLDSQKNHKMLVSAYALIADDFPEDDLYIYGEGRLREEIENLSEELNVADRVHLPGSVSNVPGILSRAKLFVLSSDYEGMPNALMEAMAAGVPSISTDCPCGGPRELFGNALSEWLAVCADADSLADKMKNALENEERLAVLSNEVKSAAAAFASPAVFERWESFIAG